MIFREVNRIPEWRMKLADYIHERKLRALLDTMGIHWLMAKLTKIGGGHVRR
jgi:hypothetical protein